MLQDYQAQLFFFVRPVLPREESVTGGLFALDELPTGMEHLEPTPPKESTVEEPTCSTKRLLEQYRRSLETKSPVAPEMKSLLKAELRSIWYEDRHHKFLAAVKLNWRRTDQYKIVLNDALGKVETHKVHYLCNKLTAFYWLPSAQQADQYGQPQWTIDLITAAVYEEWYHFHKNDPPIDFQRFFASPVRITSTGPSTIAGVIVAHISICKQAAYVLQLIDSTAYLHKHYSFLPLFQAIVVVVDSLYLGPFDGDEIPSSSYHGFSQHQTVVIARTGVEDGMSAPISLESLRDEAVTFQPSAVKGERLDLIRVPLATAVQFITNLQVREERLRCNPSDEVLAKIPPFLPPELRSRILEFAIPRDLDICPSPPKGFLKKSVSNSPEAWADANILSAEEHEYETNWHIKECIDRIQASLTETGRPKMGFLRFGDDFTH